MIKFFCWTIAIWAAFVFLLLPHFPQLFLWMPRAFGDYRVILSSAVVSAAGLIVTQVK